MAEPASAPQAADEPAAQPLAVDAGGPGQEQATVEVPAAEAPTEQLQAISATAPPPAMDLTTRLPLAETPAAPAQAAPSSEPAPVADPQQQAQPAADEQATPTETVPRRPGFRARGRMRRRLRYLRKLRELQARDLGGLVFDLRRFERKRDDLVAQKLDQIRACDDELHALERALDERRDLRDVREPGVGGTCPRCFAIYGSADKFCANCGAALGGAVQSPAHAPLAPPTPPPAGTPEAGGSGPQA